MNARRADRAVTAPYGQVINLGVVQFTVTARARGRDRDPRHRRARVRHRRAGRWPAAPRRREETDVIDVSYTAEDPATAQRIVNATVQAFQSLNVQWARERSRRRREFLAEQLAQTDSMLARAQAELSSFRSRQQLASSRDKLNATQTATLQLDAQHGRSSRPTGRPSARLQQQLKSSDEATRDAGAPRPGAPRRPWPRTPRSAGSTSSCSSTSTGSTR